MDDHEWYWCLEHKAAERGDGGCPPDSVWVRIRRAKRPSTGRKGSRRATRRGTPRTGPGAART